MLAVVLPAAAQGGLTLNEVLDNNALTFTAGNQPPWELRATGGVNDGDAAHVDLSSGGNAWIDSTVTGPGWITFVTNACHSLIVDTTSYSICPWQRWVPYGEGLLVRREIPAGLHAIRWILQGSGSGPLDGWLDAVEFIPIASIPLSAMTTPAGLTFFTGSEHPCHGTTWPDANGGGAIRPPASLPESQSAWVETTITGPAEVEFLSWVAGNEIAISARIGSLNSYAFSPNGPSDKHGPGWRTTRFFITESGAVPVRWWLQAGSALDGIIVRPEVPLTEALDAAGIQWTRRGRKAFYGTPLNSHDGADAITLDRFFSGAGEAPPELATTLTGPLFFRLMAKFENGDAPDISWNGNKALVRWSPADNGWQSLAVAIPADSAPGELVIGGTPGPLWLDEASLESLAGHTIADGLETAAQTWLSSTGAAWQFSPLSHRSNPDTIALWLPAGSQSAWIETTVTGPGVVRFEWHGWEGFMRPSSRLMIDGQEFMALPHQYDAQSALWNGYEFALPSGNHTLRWETTKDDNGAGAVAEMDAFSFTQGPPSRP